MFEDISSPQAQELLRQVLDGTPAAIVVLDRELRFRYVNPALARMNGLPAEEHLGRTAPEVLPALDTREDVLRAVISASRSQQHELERARERLTLLDGAATRIGATLDLDTTCAEPADFLVQKLSDSASVEVFLDGHGGHPGHGLRPVGEEGTWSAAMRTSTPRCGG